MTTCAGLGLEPVDEIERVEEAAAFAGTDAAAGDRYREVGLAGTGAADEDAVALFGDEVAAGEIAHESLVDRRADEGEVGDVLGERQPGDRHLVLDGSGQLLVDLGLSRSPDETLRLVLALDGGGDDLVEAERMPKSFSDPIMSRMSVRSSRRSWVRSF